MTDFFSIKRYTIKHLQNLINNRVEESLHLEFKDGRKLNNQDLAKNGISKAISAIANSDGGIIIFGMTEKEHVAHEISEVDGKVLNKEWLEQIINSYITPIIPNIEIFPVRINNEINKTVYIVKIPKSSVGPHMAFDKKYYRRYNFMAIPMEEYEIRDQYNYRAKPQLVFRSIKPSYTPEKAHNGAVTFHIQVRLLNIGRVPEMHYKTCLYFRGMKDGQITIEPDSGSILKNDIIEDTFKIYNIGGETIFPTESTTGLSLYIICHGHIRDYASIVEMEFTVFYTGGEYSKTFKLEEILKASLEANVNDEKQQG